MPALDAFATETLEKLQKNQRLRTLVPLEKQGKMWVQDAKGARFLSFASNDYLGLSEEPTVCAAAQAIAAQTAGAGASRLAGGNSPAIEALEADLATWKQMPAARVFGSGYLANLGVISSLMSAGDAVFADKLSHACMLDGARLSDAALHRFAHNDVAALEKLLKSKRGDAKNALIMCEAVYSMDGDAAPIDALLALAETYDAWLLIDVAHALVPLPKLPPERVMMVGTMSKSLGAYGGFVAGGEALMQMLQSTARSLLFSTALPPSTIAAAHAALKLWMVEDTRAKAAMNHAQYFAREMGLSKPDAAIVPLMVGEEGTALAMMERLKAEGFYVPAIRPPTVPVGTSRLRFSFSALHETADIQRLIKILKEIV